MDVADVVIPVVVIGLSMVVPLVREGVLPRLALRRLERRHDVGVPGRLRLRRRPERALIRRRGADVVVQTRRRVWLVPARDVVAARGRTSAGPEHEAWTLRLIGPEGTPAWLEVPERYRSVLHAVASADVTAPQRPRRLGRRVPRWPIVVGSTSAVGLAAWLWILLRTTPRTSPVTRVTDDGPACWVQWAEGSAAYHGAPTCPDPTPSVGDPMPYLTTPWPVRGYAWDVDLPWVVVALLGVALVSAVARLLVRALTARGHSGGELASVVTPGSNHPPRPQTTGPSGASPTAQSAPAVALFEVLDRAEAELGWADLPLGRPQRDGWWSGWWADLRGSARSAPRWSLFVAVVGGGVAGGADEGADTPFGTLGLVTLGLGLVWTLARFLDALLRARRAWRAPASTPWAHRAVQDASDEWWFLLLDGRQPRWLVAVDGRPPLRGTCLVRGELTDGGIVHLLLHDSLWLPTRPVVEVDSDVLTSVRDDLEYQLTGSEPDPATP